MTAVPQASACSPQSTVTATKRRVVPSQTMKRVGGLVTQHGIVSQHWLTLIDLRDNGYDGAQVISDVPVRAPQK